MLNEIRQKIVEKYINAYNNFDIEAMCENLCSDIEFKNSQNGIVTLSTHGIYEFKDVATRAQDFFEKRKQTILEYEYLANSVTVYTNFEAVLSQDVNDDFEAGDSFKVAAKSIFTFDDETIISIEDIS